VGQGGLLYEYTDDIIEPRYREDMRDSITEAAYGSMEAQRHYLREHWREVLEDYLEAHPEYRDSVAPEIGEDLTGFSDCDIPYEMGDYMPVWLVDEDDHLTHVFNYDTEEIEPLFDDDGQATGFELYTISGHPVPRVLPDGRPFAFPMFDDHGLPIPRCDAKGRRMRTMACYKIEPNPGAGLWRPHNDQLPPERRGEGVYTIFRCLGQRGQAYRSELHRRTGGTPSGPAEPTSAVHIPALRPGPGVTDDAGTPMVRARAELAA